MLNEEDGPSLGGLTAVLGQFGLGGGDKESNLDKIIELSRARTITEKALFVKKDIGGKNDLLANHLINSLEKNKRWYSKGPLGFMSNDSLSLKGFRFTHDDFASFSILENKALKNLHTIMVGKNRTGGSFQSEFSELSGIMNFNMTSPDPRISIAVANSFYDELGEYYLGKNINKQSKDFNLVKIKYDSIQTALDNTMFAIAKFEDNNRGLVSKKDAYRLKKLKAEEYKLGLMLGEVEKQYQIAQLTKERVSEFLQVIDRPLLPLKPVNKGRIYYFLLGGFLGGLLSIVYLVLKKIYQDILQNA